MTDWCSERSQGSGGGQVRWVRSGRNRKEAASLRDWYSDRSGGSGGTA